MDLIDLLLTIALIIGYVFTAYFQNKKIDSYKDSMDAMQKFFGIFDIDELEKYVKLKDENNKIENQKIIKQIEYELKNIESEKSNLAKEHNQKNIKILNDYASLLAHIITNLILKVKKDERKESFDYIDKKINSLNDEDMKKMGEMAVKVVKEIINEFEAEEDDSPRKQYIRLLKSKEQNL